MGPNFLKTLADQLIAARLGDAVRRRRWRTSSARLSIDERTGDPLTPAGEKRATGAATVVETPEPRIRPELVDRMIELYCDWRTECAGVHTTYERFRNASRPVEDAFAGYIAALDREQSACEIYAEQVRLIESQFAAQTARARPSATRSR
ncbi:MAG TPA: hypothetical protein VMD09_07560 [Solirubrobacteraceae bacterium]|nr:hypothetical protein [Solirubrobacteraceae bacterium]